MMENDLYDLVIIGGGPAGLTAGLYAMRAALKTILIEKSSFGGQAFISKELENYPGLTDITGFDLSERLFDHAKSYGLEVMQKHVLAVEANHQVHSVRLEGGRTLRAYSVILATGGTPRKLNVAGEAELLGKGVSYCATCDGYFFKDRDVVVVGGGDSAVEEALYLAKIARSVHIIHRRDAFRASKILEERLIAEPAIRIEWNTVISEIKGNGDGVHSVALRNSRTGREWDLSVEGVFILIGLLANNELVPAGVQLDDRGYVITDEKHETSIPGIFAAGDLRRQYAKQIVIAAAEGCTAALAAARYVQVKKPAGVA
jgi:thioredoxin reductase (NADPH)